VISSRERPAADEAAARAALVRAWPAVERLASAPRLRRLAGGLRPRSWLVNAGGLELVLRLPQPGGAPLLDVAAEARVMRAAAARDLAPAVVAVDEAGGALLTAYRAAAVWTPVDARAAANVVRIAALLRSLHALDVAAPTFAAASIAARYLAELAAADAAPAAADDRLRDELVRRARRFDAEHAPTALCHNDLVAANVLDDGALRLIDFEYAVRAAPLLDLAGLAAMNDYAERERRVLLEAYFGDVAPARAAALDDAIRLVRLLAYFWARLGERNAVDPRPYAELAAELGARLAAPNG
jgi:thiamine kinase-like enzyme